MSRTLNELLHLEIIIYLYYAPVWLSGRALRQWRKKGCGFDSQGTHILMKMYKLDAIVSRFG